MKLLYTRGFSPRFSLSVSRSVASICLLFLLQQIAISARAQPFVHPGLLQSREDLSRIKAEVERRGEPVYSSFLLFSRAIQSSSDYQMQGPLVTVGRNPTVGQVAYDSDANAAYQNALMWAITGEKAHARKAIEILNKWSATLKSVTGRDAVLMAGLGPFKMVNAAEIIRFTDAGWKNQDMYAAQQHFKNVIYPVICDFAPFANGNWDSAAMKTAMAIGVFCDDRNIFDKVISYYMNGGGDGRLTNYIVDSNGQCQESGRDQAHTQLGIAHLADCSEIAWQQGLDLYGYEDNRLLKGFEYTAKYNLNLPVPYTPAMDRTGKYYHAEISTESRGRLRPIYEQVYNHFVKRRGLSAPFLEQAASKVRPEPQGSPGADHTGFGTLLYTRPAEMTNTYLKVLPATPAGLIPQPEGKRDRLTIRWAPVISATAYVIERTAEPAGKFLQVGTTDVPYFEDKAVLAGKYYVYRVKALNTVGTGPASLPLSVSAGLPPSWKIQTIGNGHRGTATLFNKVIQIEGAGTGRDSTADNYTFLCRELGRIHSIRMRYVPQLSSQFTSFGLAARESLREGAPAVILKMLPEPSGNAEAPKWTIKFQVRKGANYAPENIFSRVIDSGKVVTNGRMTGSCHLRLDRTGDNYTAFWSIDGQKWDKLAEVTESLGAKALIGPVVSSGIRNLTTSVLFDRLAWE